MDTSNSARQGILLESGTNEVEIIEFYLAGQSFGINVAKVKQIVQFDEKLLTRVPQANPLIMGLFMFRDNTIPLVDLNKALGNSAPANEKPLVLVTEFNNVINSFMIDGVNRIHRASWSDIKPLDALLEGCVSCFTGSMYVEKRQVLIIDLEHLLSELNPSSGIIDRVDKETAKQIHDAYGRIKIIIAEDSTFIRNAISSSLKHAGFDIAGSFDNGLSAFEFVKSLREKAEAENKSIKDFADAIITDIEMPSMDGLTLCRNIKENLMLRKFPVIIFSSLINEQLIAKCKTVGADAYIGKPQIENLKSLLMETLQK